MEPDLWSLYRQMLRSRRFETAIIDLWAQGSISGEMHLGVGEEAIAVGVVAHLRDGDALSLDHRGTPPLVARGVDLVLILRELLGQESGLCGGQGGHMHLFSREHLAASSGIVGAACPAAVGFALANRQLRPGAVAVAFFGEGAMNQGMVMESLNLAAAWELPVLFVCKDNDWAITTRSSTVTAGDLCRRAQSFDIPAQEIDGTRVEAVWQAAGDAVERARNGDGPSFLLARCVHFEGHMLGDALLRLARHPVQGMRDRGSGMMRAIAGRGGASLGERASSLGEMTAMMQQARRDSSQKDRDPLRLLRRQLEADEARLQAMEREVADEIERVVAAAQEA